MSTSTSCHNWTNNQRDLFRLVLLYNHYYYYYFDRVAKESFEQLSIHCLASIDLLFEVLLSLLWFLNFTNCCSFFDKSKKLNLDRFEDKNLKAKHLNSIFLSFVEFCRFCSFRVLSFWANFRRAAHVEKDRWWFMAMEKCHQFQNSTKNDYLRRQTKVEIGGIFFSVFAKWSKVRFVYKKKVLKYFDRSFRLTDLELIWNSFLLILKEESFRSTSILKDQSQFCLLIFEIFNIILSSKKSFKSK